MHNYETVVDFRTMQKNDLWHARSGFRFVIPRANYHSDLELNNLFFTRRLQRLVIDERLEDVAGYGFAVGAAMAHQIKFEQEQV